MTREIKAKYLFTGMFLVSSMSAYEYLLDPYTAEIQLHYPELDKRFGRGHQKMDGLGLWLARDLHWYLKKPRTEDEKEAKKILRKYELLQPTFLQWAERLRAKAQQTCHTSPILKETVVIYYFACGWLLRVLIERNRFVGSLKSREVSVRSQKGNKHLQNVIDHLQKELVMIMKDITDQPTVDYIRSEIENICNELAEEWREQLLSFAQMHLDETS